MSRCTTPARPPEENNRPDIQESTLNALSALVPMSATDGGEGFHPPTIKEFFPPAVLFDGTPFELNRIMLIRLLAMAVVVIVFAIYVRRSKLVPDRGTGTVEMAIDLIRTQVADLILGEKDGRRFLPLLATIFFLVFALNITGIIPLLNIAGTSVVGMPLVLALVVYVTFIVVGIRANGAFGYFRNTLAPPGIPPAIYILYTPIEALAVFVLRPATLTIRLLANMIAGHFLLVLCFSGTNYLFFEAGAPLAGLGILTLAFGFAFTLFEIIVALLQAYIFSLLAAVYINSSLHVEH